MTQKEKELLLKDLCSRSHYGVKVDYFDRRAGDFCVDVLGSVYPLDEHVFIGRLPFNFDFDEIYLEDNLVDIENVKPYLFPLSSMTEEHIAQIEFWSFMKEYHKITDFYYENHIDYRGLIDMGLAIDATNLNIY